MFRKTRGVDMPDWKKRIDVHLNKGKNREKLKQIELVRKVLDEKLKLLASRFKCHISICNKVATKPATETSYLGGLFRMDFNNWDLPGDLYKCSVCDQWTCEDHIYRCICYECANKL